MAVILIQPEKVGVLCNSCVEDAMPDQSSEEKLFGKYQEIVLLLLGFVLTSIIGGIIGERFQRRSWEHEHLVQVCETERNMRSKGFSQISDLMDKRLLRTRQLAWKLQTAHSLKEVDAERKGNRDARDEWAMRLNSNLRFTETYFGAEARNSLEQDITGGFSKIHKEFNDLFKNGKLDKEAATQIESDIDAFNPTVYLFDSKMEQIITDKANGCSTLP
jgi:hypothetical protein